MTKVEELHKNWLKDANYRKAYAELEEEYSLIAALIDARLSAGLTQAQLARRMKTTHTNSHQD